MVEQMADILIEECEREEQMISSENVESVSFGRFENDLLCWERWSSFSQNKYLEEVEKCSTPGSVASKKAYFEAHYKKIAARKAELEQEQQLESDSLRSNYPSSGNQTQNGSNYKFDLAHRYEPNQDAVGVDSQDSFSQGIKEGTDSQQESMGLENSAVAVKEENPLEGSQAQSEELSLVIKEENRSNRSPDELEDLPIFIKEENKPTVTHTQSELLPIISKEDNQSTVQQAQPVLLPILIKEENQSTVAQVQSELMPGFPKEEKSSTGSQAKFEEVDILVREEIHSELQLEHPHQLHNESNTAHVNKAGNTKLKSRKEPQMRNPASKEKNLLKEKKKPATPITKPSQTSVPRKLKPTPASPVISTSRIPTRKESSSSLQRNKKNPSNAESKRSVSTSLHTSINVPPTNSDSTFHNTTRRSFIMENMGDKDIVKRAFRTFQNTYDPSKSYAKGVSSTPQQISEKGPERNTSSITPQKDKERTGPALGKESPQRKQVGTRSNSLSTRPVKAASVNQTSTKAASSFGSRSDERAEKRKEFLRKLDEISKANEKESTRLRPKSKDSANSGIRHRSESWR